MPGESLQRDLAEVLEFYGEHERLKMHPSKIAWYLLEQLQTLRGLDKWRGCFPEFSSVDEGKA